MLITAGWALLAVAGVLLYSRDTEPSYNGRPLAQWIKAIAQVPGDREAHDAIVCITTNSFPVLLRWAFAADTTPRFPNLIYNLPFSVSQNPHLRPLFYRDDQIFRAACALRAFEIAGANAAGAVPALTGMMNSHNPQVTIDAIHVCSLIGPPAVPAIRRAMTNPHPFIRVIAIGSLKRIGTNAIEVFPDMVKALSDYDTNVRKSATNVLETIYPQLLTNATAQ